MYHGVDEHAGDPDRELVPAIGSSLFERQLRHLKRHYEVVPVGRLQEAVETRSRGARYPVAVTFDDDLRSHVAVALPILRRTGVKAMFFLTGVSLDDPYSFWWERIARTSEDGLSSLARSLDLKEQEPVRITALGDAIKQLQPSARAELEARLAEVAGADPTDAGLRASDVHALLEAGMEIGFHTLRHNNLRLLAESPLAREMEDGRAALEAIVGRPLRVVCYPYGEADDRVANAAREAAFVLGFTARRDSVKPTDDPLLCGRVSPSHRSVGHLAARLVVTLLQRR